MVDPDDLQRILSYLDSQCAWFIDRVDVTAVLRELIDAYKAPLEEEQAFWLRRQLMGQIKVESPMDYEYRMALLEMLPVPSPPPVARMMDWMDDDIPF